MAKYDPLNERLRESRAREVRLSFGEIERLLGAGLPKAARERQTWWANADSAQAAAWLDAGYAPEVDLDGEIVTWRRAGDDRLAPAREAIGARVGQARELFDVGAAQVEDALGRIPPPVRRAAPWVLLGAAVLTVVGVFVQRGARDRG